MQTRFFLLKGKPNFQTTCPEKKSLKHFTKYYPFQDIVKNKNGAKLRLKNIIELKEQ